MFTSSALAPDRTCSSATSTAASRSPASTSERNRAEPVTFVRSPIITNPVSGPSSKGSSPLQRVRGSRTGIRRWRNPFQGRRDLTDVLGGRAAAAADDVHEPVLGERAEVAARVSRLLVVLAHRVREPGVRVAGDVRVRDAGEILEERPHLARAERAVDAGDERPRVLDGDPERLRRLPREVAAAAVDRREREPQRQVGRDVRRGDDRRLRVEGVEDRLDEEQVDPTLGERGDLLRVGGAHLLEGDRAERRVLDLRRHGERDVERAEGSGDEARPVRRPRGPLVGGPTREAGALDAHLGREALERVVGLADRRGRERVRSREIGPGREVLVVDLGHDVGASQVEEIRVTLDVARVLAQPLAAVLRLGEPLPVDEDAPRAIVDHDALREDLLQSVGRAHVTP